MGDGDERPEASAEGSRDRVPPVGRDGVNRHRAEHDDPDPPEGGAHRPQFGDMVSPLRPRHVRHERRDEHERGVSGGQNTSIFWYTCQTYVMALYSSVKVRRW